MRKKVFIILETAGQPGRSQLIGILRGINDAHLDWDLDVVLSRRKISAAIVRRAFDVRTHGVILANPVREGVPEKLLQMKKPTVFMDVVSVKPPVGARSSYASLRVDDEAIGQTAARHFLALGNFRSFAFVHYPRDEIWTRERQIAFAAVLADAGFACHVFTPSDDMDRAADLVGMADFLRALPLPIAVMAANDRVGDAVARACETAGLSIPEEVAILGVDNDMTVCNNLTPRLSSIEPDFEEEGFRAVVAMERLFGNKIELECKKDRAVKIIERGTTRPLPPATRLVDRALAFIEANYNTPITPRDVARHLGVSRRLIDMRFRQLQHESILTAITRLRLDMLCGLLKEENGKLKDLATACGFGSVIRVAHLFKERYGMSMTGYRNRHA